MRDLRFRPMPIWPYKPTEVRRSRWTFKAGFDSTLSLLERELRHLGASNAVVGCGLAERDVRNDGWPRSDARVPAHPGVEVSFDSPHGRLVYATDVCETWQHNLRAIGLGLEALRAVDRHGVTRSGEQYAGFKALPSPDGDAVRGEELVREHGGITGALHATHPDHGGSREDFSAVQAYRRQQ